MWLRRTTRKEQIRDLNKLRGLWGGVLTNAKHYMSVSRKTPGVEVEITDG